ncbi:MAG: kelch repeat-containing protein [Phycisphaerales bacterium]|jgi:N-acetylneuraminic acid mutarotase|nr:kelch repeat-containing protein [Phycisphaerales bacterium]
MSRIALAAALALALVVRHPAQAAGAQQATDTWSAAPSMAFERSAHAVASDDHAIYVVAGTGGTPPRPIEAVERFDGREWTTLATLPGPGLNAPSLSIVDGRLYVVGGFSGTTNLPTSTVHVYDPESRQWSTAAPLPDARGGHAAVVLEGKIHVIGGGNDRSTLATHSVYDPEADAWSDLAPLPRSEGSPAAVVYDGRIWAIGGRSGGDDFGEVYIFDPGTGAWSQGPPLPPRGTHGAVVFHGAIHVFGGESQAEHRVMGEALRLDPETHAWRAIDPLTTPRNYARAAVIDGAVFVIGGSTEPGGSHASRGSAAVERMGD